LAGWLVGCGRGVGLKSQNNYFGAQIGKWGQIRLVGPKWGQIRTASHHQRNQHASAHPQELQSNPSLMFVFVCWLAHMHTRLAAHLAWTALTHSSSSPTPLPPFVQIAHQRSQANLQTVMEWWMKTNCTESESAVKCDAIPPSANEGGSLSQRSLSTTIATPSHARIEVGPGPVAHCRDTPVMKRHLAPVSSTPLRSTSLPPRSRSFKTSLLARSRATSQLSHSRCSLALPGSWNDIVNTTRYVPHTTHKLVRRTNSTGTLSHEF
jgi:hypothetical protein